MRARTTLLFVASTLAACAGEEPPERAAEDAAGVGAPLGSVEIIEPSDGDTVAADLRVVLRAQGVVVEAALGERVEGSGHHHIFVDTDVTPWGEPIPKQVEGIIHLGTGASEFTIKELAPGEHRLIAVLAYGDHVAMEGVAADTARVLVLAQ